MSLIRTKSGSATKLKLTSLIFILLNELIFVLLRFPFNLYPSNFKSSKKFKSIEPDIMPFVILLEIKLLILDGFVLIINLFASEIFKLLKETFILLISIYFLKIEKKSK